MSLRNALKVLPVAGFLAVATPSLASAQTQQTGQATFGNLIAALNNIAVEVGQLRALNNIDINRVRVVNVQDLLNGNNVQALNNALNRNDVNVLRNVLNNNQCSVVAVCDALKNFLNNNNVAIGQLVAVDVLSGGDVILFYQRP